MNHIEQMKSWLEVLEHIDYEDNDRDFLFPYQRTMLDNAITTLRTAIEQMERQEPVAITEQMAKRRVFDAIRGAYDLGFNDARNARTTPGDSAPGYKGRDVEADHGGALISALERYTHPPAAQRQWVGLTLEDKQHIIDNNFGGSRADCMDEAEKILREKNA